MKNVGQARRALVVLAIALATGMSVVAACGSPSDNAEPPGAAPAVSDPHAGHVSAPPAAPLRAGERFQSLSMPAAYTPQAPNGGTDEYRCFLIDPKLTKTAYLTGSQFLPQNAAIVHHAIFFRIAPGAADQARKLDADSPGEGWTCFGDSGVNGDAWVASWAPGANETLLAPNLGYPMPPGSMVVMQVHYNLLATGGRPGGADQSSIRLRINDDTAAMTALQTGLLPAPIELPCTAGESGPLCDRSAAVADVGKRFGDDIGGTEDQLIRQCNKGNPPVAGVTQHCDHKVPQAATVYAVAGHMHLLGRSIKIELNPGTAGAKTLLDVPNYNFDDQAIRPLDTPVALKPGDTLRVTCTHDAALRGLLPQLKGSAPRYVVWGDGTSDEMCLGLVVMTAASRG
ncbi:monooxygenase [Dactylosporangium sp. NPDC049140]|uniref:monooxygenase n=1 Tax=Dactylosporangium sp. NPDC049140 TaxID=3155647 RepID=UPI0033DB6CF0